MRPPREDTLPWYKQFWPWFLIALPLSVVIAALYTLTLAIKSDDGLVSDDYYKEGLAIYKDADSTARAEQLGIAGSLKYDTETGAVSIKFDKPLPPDSGLLTLAITHPTRPDHDQIVQLTPVSNQAYTGRIEPIGPAHWKLQLYAPDKSWRIKGRLVLPGEPIARLDRGTPETEGGPGTP